MSAGNTAIRIEGIGKRYPLSKGPKSRSIREAITAGAMRMVTRSRDERGGPVEDFWALRDITLNVPQGQSVGLIGANGSGKSTLLKIISRIVKPTEGTAEIRGRVGALLEVGTGFHPDLTGRDNIFLNGAIIGMSGTEIRSRFDEIVDFSGIEPFLDTPIKRYSSGMVMRLAFAVAAHLEPDVLIVDEVLAVGDAEFQRKSLNKINDVSANGCTVFFVSHNLGFVQQLCNRAMILEHGRLIADGDPPAVVTSYLRRNAAHASPSMWEELSPMPGGQSARFTAIRYSDPLSPEKLPHSRGPIRIETRIHADEPFRAAIAVDIHDEMGNRLINLDPWKSDSRLIDVPAGESVWAFDIDRIYLNGGTYVVELWLGTAQHRTIEHRLTAMRFSLLGDDMRVADGMKSAQADGLVVRDFTLNRMTDQSTS